jgi:hypothetical protein
LNATAEQGGLSLGKLDEDVSGNPSKLELRLVEVGINELFY